MITLVLLFNAFFTWYFWVCAKAAFEEGRNATGWVDLFFSAFNAAVVMNYFWS